MRDNAIFFLDEGDPSAVRDALASISAIEPESVMLAPAIGYRWKEASHYRGATVLQWHRYARGDLKLEFEVLLGGQRLCPTDEAGENLINELAGKLNRRIVFVSADGATQFTEGHGLTPVRLTTPEEYGDVGPKIVSGG